jgi:hypothetical protein
MHDETYRMLGREHEADLEREAARWRLAAEIRGQRRGPAAVARTNRRPNTRPSFAFWVRFFAPIRQHEGG